jgi:uncharacterized protein
MPSKAAPLPPIERRATPKLELRTEAGATVLRGYAAVFNAPSFDLGGFVEIIRPGAFARTLSDGGDILALAHHDTTRVLARRSAKSLTLSEDDHGLVVEIRLSDTTHAKDIAEDIRTGNIDAMSFGFRTRKDSWTRGATDGEPQIRELLDVDLHEVSPVAFPAYPDTSIALRSLEDAQQAALAAAQPPPIAPEILAAHQTLHRARLRLLAIEA